MSNVMAAALSWIAVAISFAAGILAKQRGHASPLLPAVNLITGLLILGYWVPRWYSYAFRGITFYATDQLVPAYALLIAVLSIFALAGRSPADWPHWLVLGMDTMVLIAAACFFTFVRINKLF